MTSWLRGQKKSDLVDIAESVGLKNVASLKKSDLELSLDEYLLENASQLSSDPKLAPYYTMRSKSILTSPLKKEAASSSDIKPPKRRQTKPAQEESAATEEEEPVGRSTALLRTPGRALSLASRIPLPASPAVVAQAVDRSALAVRERVVSIYTDSGITEATLATRESLSTVTAIVVLVSAFEWYFLAQDVLPKRHAFSIPAIAAIGTSEYPVSLPDVFLFATSSFWAPTLIWLLLSFVGPALAGYFFNLSAASGSHHAGRGRSRPFSTAEYAIDPLSFSVAKAVLVYVVLAQGVDFAGLLDNLSVQRISYALYGGWKGVLSGTAITGLASLYDAVLRK